MGNYNCATATCNQMHKPTIAVLVRRNIEHETHRCMQPGAHMRTHLLGYFVTRGVAGVDENHLAKGLLKQKIVFFVE